MATSTRDRPWPATLTLGPDGRINSWSRGAQALFGLSAGKACGRRLRTLLVRPEDRAAVDELFGSVLAGRSWSGTLPLIGADGGTHALECGWQPVQDRRGRAGALVVITNRVGGPDAEPVVEEAPLGSADAALETISHFREQAATVAMMRRVQLLTDANTQIGSTLDMSETAAELMEVAVPRFADAASVNVLASIAEEYELPEGRAATGAGTVLQRLASRPETAEDAEYFPVGGAVAYAPGSPFAQALATGRSRTLTGLDRPAAEKLCEGMGVRQAAPLFVGRSLLIVPVVARGAVLGLVVFVRSGDRRPFSPGEAVLGEELVARAALCIDNARLYSHERQTALMLQRALLPDESGGHSGIDIAHRYLPASDLTGVGGDWYDVIDLGGGRVALVVGDVMGHGVRAAAVMGQLRTATRTLAALDLQPADVLRHLDGLMDHLGGSLEAGNFATCIVAVYDPTERICRIARAGHVPPLLVTPDGSAALLDIPPGVPLGVGGHAFESRDVPVEDGSLLVLCTDGLVESRAAGRDIDDGLRDLVGGIKDPAMPLEAIADGLIAGLRGDRTLDDAALMVARVRGIPPSDSVEWTVEPEPPAVSRSRRAVRSTLSDWGLDRLGDTAQLLTSELVTNALIYTRGPISVRLMRDRTLLCEVYDGSETVPRLRAPVADDDDGGRGLRLVKELSSRWGTRRTTTGKTVWFELPLDQPAGAALDTD